MTTSVIVILLVPWNDYKCATYLSVLPGEAVCRKPHTCMNPCLWRNSLIGYTVSLADFMERHLLCAHSQKWLVKISVFLYLSLINNLAQFKYTFILKQNVASTKNQYFLFWKFVFTWPFSQPHHYIHIHVNTQGVVKYGLWTNNV